MIILDEYIVEFEGKKYIPLEIAEKAILENSNVKDNIAELEKAMDDIKKLAEEINFNIDDIKLDD